MAAAVAKPCLVIFLLSLVFSVQIEARDSQFFNKVPSNNGEKETQQAAVVPTNEETLNNKQEQVQAQEPNFVPENENGGYGLYGHDAGQFPPTTTTAAATNNGENRESFPKYLPKNYNKEAYVTEPEGYRGGESAEQFENNNKRAEFDNNKNPNFYNSQNNYYTSEKQGLGETNFMDKSFTTNNANNGNYYYNNNGNSNSNSNFLYNEEQQQGMNSNDFYNGEQQQGLSDTRLASNNFYIGEQEQQQQGLSDTRFYSNNNNKNYYNHNFGNQNGVQKQGMSDTRFLENGKYFYDLGMEQNSNRGPYESRNNRGIYGNPQNSYEFNNNYQGQGQNNEEQQFQNFQEDEDLP